MKNIIYNMWKLALAMAIAVMLPVLTQAQSAYDYVTSPNNNYFNTGYKPNSNTKVYLMVSFQSNTGSDVCGSWISDGKSFALRHEDNQVKFSTGSNNGNVKASYNITLGNIYCITFSMNELTIDSRPDATLHLFSQTFDTPAMSFDQPLCIGGFGGASLGNAADIRIYDCIIYENGKKLYEYIPSRSNGEPRLYEVMNGGTISSTNNGDDKSISTCPTMPTTCQHKYASPTDDGRMHCPVCNTDVTLSQFKNTSNAITVTDPALNLQGELGHQVMTISSSDVTAAKVQEKTSGKVRYSSTSLSTTSTGSMIDLAPIDYPDTLYVLLKARQSQTIGTRQDTVPAWIKKEVSYLPMHKPTAIESWVRSTMDASGIKTSVNHIEFAIDSLNVTTSPSGAVKLVGMEKQDTQSDDEFLIQRSFNRNFAPFTNLQSIPLDAPDSLERVVSRSGSEKYRGWYRYEDSSVEGQENAVTNDTTVCAIDSRFLEEGGLSPVQKSILREFYTYPERKVYYRIWRSLAYSVFSDSPDKSYIKVDSILLTDVVPGVDSIAVKQNANWASNKKVNVTFKLKNPYPWEYNTMLDAQQIKDYAKLKGIELSRRYMWDSNATVIVERRGYDSKGKEVSLAHKRMKVEGSKISWNDADGYYTATLQDVQDLPSVRYYYSAWVDETSTPYPIANKTPARTTDAEAQQSESASAQLVSGLKASQGVDRGCITVEWDTSEQLGSLMLERRVFDASNTAAKWDTLSTNTQMTFYKDQKIKAGTVYEYRLTAKMHVSYLDSTYTTILTARGWESYYGRIAGHVMMNDGTAMAGVKIHVTRTTPVYIADVTDEYGHVLMEGVHEGVNADARRQAAESDDVDIKGDDFLFQSYAVTDENGYWSMDSVYIDDDGCQYIVQIMEYPGEFQYQGIQQAAKITLTGQTYEDTAVDFRYMSTTKITGHAYYTNSTVAVPGAHFYLDGTPLRDSKGDYVTTQPDGKFSLTVSSMEKIDKLEIRKDGHKFADDGIICSNTVVSSEIDQMILYDNTKVRIAGRICGGDVQGKLAMGQGLSKNNLGDNLQIELQLEGDVTASLVYFPSDPDRSSVISTTETASGTTQITMERKRIYIKADNKTGEFLVDLFPAKYKVSSMSAVGYPSLYTSGEGLMVVDYSNIPHNEEAPYDTIFKRIYHEPLTVTYAPIHNGRETAYSGEKSITHTDGTGRDYTQTVWDEENGYYFGHPVFIQNYMYQYRVYAHEDYLYNKTAGGTLDVVPVGNDSLIVRNGIESNNSVSRYKMDANGQLLVYLLAANTTFTQTGSNALRTATFTVVNNGEYCSATPLSGFILGEHTTGVDATPLGSCISLIDVLRDPPGSKSYAYRERGTTYEWNYDTTAATSRNTTVSTKFGWGFFNLTGFGVYFGGETDVYGNATLNITTQRETTRTRAYYKMTANERISTATDTYGIGSGGDVYLGLAKTYGLRTDEEITVVDSTSYSNLKHAIDQGAVKVVAENPKNNTYIVIGDKANVVESSIRSFAYSQKHIVDNIIPNLYKKLWSIVSVGDSATLFAGDSDQPRYWLDTKNYVVVFKAPSNDQLCINMADSILSAIKGWMGIIMENEYQKVAAIGTGNPCKQYSLSEAAIDYSESASSYYTQYTWKPDAIVTISGGFGGEKKTSDPASSENQTAISKLAGNQKSTEKANTNNLKDSELIKSGIQNNIGDINNNIKNSEILNSSSNNIDNNSSSSAMNELNKLEARPRKAVKNASGMLLEISFNSGKSTSTEIDQGYVMTNSAGYGYVLESGDDSYFDIDVFHANAGITIDNTAIELVNGVGNSVQAESNEDNTMHNFIFEVKGGAQRNPWVEPDSTLYYNPGTPLGAQTLKIDNPKIYVDQPVVNNIPKNESAVFQIRLTNASEATLSNIVDMKPSTFHLRLLDNSNPYGAKVSIDGQSISNGRTFIIAPGESITKTVEVARGASGYDYDNLCLEFYDDGYSIFDYANLSVHYLPESTPLTITAPADKWVMNTYSSTDKDSLYYLPVSIGDFNATCDRFHHIELQYKRHNDGDDQWTTIRSFFMNDSIYRAWSGAKQMLQSSNSVENIPFYGGTNIEEQEYDLRAVSFCTYGNSYVTKASSVLSGIKDTRRPEIFGVPTPANGVLTFQDVIEFPYSEKIAYNHLNSTSNFTVQGYTRETNAVFSEPLHFTGSEDESAKTSVNRVLANSSFTVDMMAKIDTVSNHFPVLFSHGTPNSQDFLLLTIVPSESFSVRTDPDYEANKGLYRLVFFTANNSVISEPLKGLSPDLTLTRLGLIVNQPAGTSVPDISFIADQNIIQADDQFMKRIYEYCGQDYNDYAIHAYNGYGQVYIGSSMFDTYSFKGDITEVRLWNKALTQADITETYNKRLSGYNRNLMDYWPMNEGQGNLAYDKVNGATLTLKGTSWTKHQGYSLSADHRVVALSAKNIASATNQDYTMSFWFRTAKDSINHQVGNATLLYSGTEELAKGLGRTRLGFKGDSLVYTTKDVDHPLGMKSLYLDGAWHKFTVIKSVSRNTGQIYVDNLLSFDGTSDDIDCLSTLALTLGDEHIKSNFDQFAVWNKALSYVYLKENYYYRMNGKESDLKVYLSFESTELDSHNLPVQVFSAANQVMHKEIKDFGQGTQVETGKYLADGTVMIEDAPDGTYSAQTGYAAIADKDLQAPLNQQPELSNLDFSWSSTGTALQININRNDKDINKQYIYVTVRDVEDEQGNTTLCPHMWSYFVDKNILKWDQQTVNITVPYGTSMTETVSWQNKSGRETTYTISNNSSWLTLSTPLNRQYKYRELRGTAQAQDQDEVILNIGDGLSPGKYSETLYLTDDNNLSEPLTVNLTVEAADPGWEVDNTRYEYSMNLRGEVILQNQSTLSVPGLNSVLSAGDVIDNDPNDKVAAFVGQECVGVANITVKDDVPMLYLTIYGDTAMQNHKSPVTLRLWRSSTGEISELAAHVSLDNLQEVAIPFQNRSYLGMPPSSPYALTITDIGQQDFTFSRGWNWFSLNVEPQPQSDGSTKLINTFSGFTEGDLIKRIDFCSYNDVNKKWEGSLQKIDKKYVFQCYAKNGGTLSVRGKEFDIDKAYVEITDGKWSDMPYYLSVVQPINVALSDCVIGQKAQVGDIIKGYNGFAVANSNKQWEGSLQYLRPGEGYYYYHTGQSSSFHYDKVNNYSSQTTTNARFSSMSKALTPTSMPVIAVMEDSVGYQAGDVLEAYCNGELIASTEAIGIGRAEARRFFLSLHATDGDEISFALNRGGESQKAATKLRYDASKVAGELDNPCVISILGAETISTDQTGDTYNIQGYKVSDTSRGGVYINNKKKYLK